MQAQRRGGELARGVGFDPALADASPGTVERAVIIAGRRERGLQQPLFRAAQRAGIEGREQRCFRRRAAPGLAECPEQRQYRDNNPPHHAEVPLTGP